MNGRLAKATEAAPAAKGKTRLLKHVGENLYRDEHGAYFTKFKVAGKRIKKKLNPTDRVLTERRRDDLRSPDMQERMRLLYRLYPQMAERISAPVVKKLPPLGEREALSPSERRLAARGHLRGAISTIEFDRSGGRT